MLAFDQMIIDELEEGNHVKPQVTIEGCGRIKAGTQIRFEPTPLLTYLTSLSNSIKGDFAHHYDQRDD
jgi:hypothetical protein